MKVVLFCGGLGTRLREYSETIPKPMVEIGYRPIIWHLMRYYAHFGHKEFILCLGYKGDYIKNYFLNYDECLSNNFTLSKGGKDIQLHTTDIEDWKITFVDTGLNLNIGERLAAVKPYLEGEDTFLANYSDGLSDLDLNLYLEYFQQQNKIASFLAVQPSQSFHVVSLTNEDGIVENIRSVGHSDLWINGGFFVLRKEIFDYISPGEELVLEPFQRLIRKQQLIAYRNPGFWACMDTLKEKILFDDMYAKGNTPWAVWESHSEIFSNSPKPDLKIA
ncbi:glucose-1-phosphate cytidylyltransferase [Leptolyngbyaceae cyanobacterium CCMR0082]|uniref:Glucose-1-phosphate cytidylyltransferase n=1 Tax=Adonisia turfae CCMR0082 TaxID=2304604 RepID=A0A6M0SFD1_9CYAN|nr:glucose-1-phosphate cytidylyltransferase [Adonisia turfae]MDV3351132.1 glucose-1-phosphate cytidylyltransferase [Leptothoe sp. LEGE 181152]NEZ67230.1 glucose-1-phosphate cytidylyltransferase [Adonisia turfae CCMR0082]